MSISCPPIASSSSRTICTTFWWTRQPAGNHVHRPAPSWRTRPARTRSLWETASASAGGCRSVGSRSWDRRTEGRTLAIGSKHPAIPDHRSPHGLRGPRPAVRLRRPGAAHRRADDAAAPRQAPPGVRRQGQRRRCEGTEHEGKPVEEVLRNLVSLPADQQAVFRNNGGGHANHSLFWESMSPDGGGEPSGDLGDAIDVRLRLLRRLQGAVRGQRRRAVRLGLDLARARRRRR